MSSLSTPSTDTSSGTLILFWAQTCVMWRARTSLQARSPTGLGNSRNHEARLRAGFDETTSVYTEAEICRC